MSTRTSLASSKLGALVAILWRIVVFFVVFAIASAAFIFPVASKLPEWEDKFPVGTLIYTGAAAAATLLLATWVMTRFVDRRAFRSIGFRFGHVPRDLAAGLWLSTAMHFAWNCLLGPVLGLTVSGSGELEAGWALLEVEGPPRFTGGAFGIEGGLAVTVTTALLVLGLAGARARSAAAGSPTPG